MALNPFESNQKFPLSNTPFLSRIAAQQFTANVAAKNYLALGFKPGYALQASELNEIQEIMYMQSTLTSNMISNWVNSTSMNPTDGVQVNGPGWDGVTPLSTDQITRNGQTISALEGWYYIQVPSTNLKHWFYAPIGLGAITIPNTASDKVIGFKITEYNNITVDSDSALYDNSSGDYDFNAEGASRYTISIERWAVNYGDSSINNSVADNISNFAPLCKVNGTTFRFYNNLLF